MKTMSITSIVVAAAAAMCTAGFAESVAPLIGAPSKKVPVLSVKKMTKTPRLGAEAREGSELILSENFDKISNNSGKLIDCPYYPRDRYDEIVEQAYQEWLADGHDPEEEKFEGPEYNPTKDLSDLYRTGRATVSDDYMQTSGWTGSFLWAGDGCMGIYMPDNGGYLVTPYNLNLHGVVRVSFKARSLQASYDRDTGIYDMDKLDKAYVYVVAAKNGGGSYVDSDYPFFSNVVVPGDNEWHEFSVEIESLYDGNDCGIQFNGMTGGTDGILIDDIRIERLTGKTITPRHLRGSHFSEEGFRVNFDSDEYADSFLVNVWEKRETGTNADTLLGFNDMETTADGLITNFNTPDGWKLDLNPSESQTGTNPEDGTPGVLFVADEEAYGSDDWLPYVMTPSNAIIGRFECDLYCIERNNTELDSNGNPKLTQLIMLGYDESGNGEYIADTYLTDENGDDLLAGDGIHLDTDNLYDEYYGQVDITGKYRQIALVVRPRGNGSVLIDNVRLQTESLTEDVLVVENRRTDGKFCDVTGLDMKCDHSFTVQAVKGDYVTPAQTVPVKAFGIPAPVALDPTEVDARGSFTANWIPVDKADGYIVELTEKFVAEEDTPGFIVMHEGFDKTDTPEWAQYDINNPYDMYAGVVPMDDFTTLTGWMAKGGSLIKGHLGCQVSEDGDMNYLQTPKLSLGYGDKSAEISVRAVSLTAEQLIIQYSFDEDVEPLMIPFVNGVAEGSVEIPDAEGLQLYFIGGILNAPNTAEFYLDYVTVKQTIFAGESYGQTLQAVQLEDGDANEYDFNGLDIRPGFHYVYSVRSYVSDPNDGDYISEGSNEVEVSEFFSGVMDVEADGYMPEIAVDGLCIHVGGEGARIFNVSGQKVAEGNVCRVPAPGVYMVVTPEGCAKVLVK